MRIVLALVAIAALVASCSGDSSSPASGVASGREELQRHEDELRDTVQEAIDAFLDGDADAFYAHFSSNFRSRCDIKAFRAILALATVFIGDLSDRAADVQITDVRFEDERAYVKASIDVEGVDLDDESDEGSFTDFWVLEDGKWKADTEEQDPCDLGEGLFGDATVTSGDGDDGDPASTGPGTSRSDAVEVGDSVTAGDLRVTVVDVNLDAADELIAADDFVDPPAAGKRYVLITLRVEHAGAGDDSIMVSPSDFKLTGSRSVVYDTFNEDSRCGFFSDEISGEMFPGGTLEGQVCFQVPEDETALILIASPFVAFSGENRRFLRLE